MEHLKISTQICLLAHKGILDNIRIIKETVARPDGEKWRHKITGVDHARLVNSTRNAQAFGMIMAYIETLRQAGFTVDANAWIESNQMTGIDEYAIHIDDTPIGFPTVREIIIDRCERDE